MLGKVFSVPSSIEYSREASFFFLDDFLSDPMVGE